MNRKSRILLIFIFLLLTVKVLTGCSWMASMDANPYDDYPVDDKAYRKQYIEQIRMKLLGLSKEEVLRILGDPAWINNLGNYQMVSKFRDAQWVFDGEKKCLMADCGPIFASESWAYGWERKTKKNHTQYGFGVFFKNNFVISVE